MKIKWYNTEFECDYAVKGYDTVSGYDDHFRRTAHIINIYGAEWEHISLIGGEWSESVPTREEALQADIDYLTMVDEALTAESVQGRADIDYLLMMIGE